MADPLKLLREFALDKKPIKEKDDFIIFGDIAFPKDVKTNFRIYGKTNEYYTLESLYCFFQKRDLVHTAYVKEAAGKQLQPVTRPDRKELIEYLTVRNAKQPTSIDVTAPIPQHVLIARQTGHNLGQGTTGDLDASGGDLANKPRLEITEDERRKQKEHMEKILNMDGGIRNAGKEAGNIRDLSDTLTANKIAALKSKVITRKRTLIKSTEDAFPGGSPTHPGAGTFGGIPLGDMDALDRDLRQRERSWRTRTSCMETTVKNFAKNVFPILQSLKAREENPNLAPTPAAKKEDPIPKRPAQQPGYSRYDQEKFRKEETEGFEINTMGTYHGITLKSITEGAKPNPHVKTPAAAQEEPARPHKRVSRTPIIVIPAGNTSLITMYNARDLLQDHKYVSVEEKKAQGVRRDNEVLIHRVGVNSNGATVPFRVVENPMKLTHEEWDRVVAVFVQGPAWQFKGWPYNSPVDIFSKVAAFHMKWDETKLDSNVAKWSVNVLTLSRTKRHLDRANLLRFWEVLNKHMTKHKPHLRF